MTIAPSPCAPVVVVGAPEPTAFVVAPSAAPALVGMPEEQGPRGPPGPKGDKGDPGTYPVYTAAAVISGDKALMFAGPGQVVPADPTADGYVYAGLALNAAQPGGAVSAVMTGDVTASFWSWAADLPVFVAPGGDLTQAPPSSGRSHLIGWALGAQTIHLAPDPVILIQ